MSELLVLDSDTPTPHRILLACAGDCVSCAGAMTRRRMSSSSPSSCSLNVPILSTLALLLLSQALLSATPTTSAVFAFAISEIDQLLDADSSAANASEFNSSSNGPHTRPKEDSFADMIDRALEKEFNETDQNEGYFGRSILFKFF